MPEIKNNFWNENGRSLQKPDLVCLKQDHWTYKALLLQLVGQIEYDVNGIRLSDANLATTKFARFIEKAIHEDVDLAITPEYSCPWTSIEQFIFGHQLPAEGKVWVLGCQSIKPNEFLDLTNRHQGVVWIYDEVLVAQRIADNRFFDPICLLMKTRDANNQIKDVIIVQFKTYNSTEIWERDNLLLGNTLYVVDNRFNSTKLLSFICSDTLQNIDLNAVNDGLLLGPPLLLIHIQLNQKPFDSAYKIYRNSIYLHGDAHNYAREIICLNWARGVTHLENGSSIEFNKYGGSSFYCKTTQINLEDNNINENHEKGLYYTSWKSKRTHVSFLNYNEHVFLVNNTKPSQLAALAVNAQRTGPKMIHTYHWSNNQWEEVLNVDDGFAQECSEIDGGAGNLFCLTGNRNFVDVERIIQLSCGDIDELSKNDWSKVLNLFSFQISDTEYNSRNTFAQDPDIDSREKRKARIRKYHFLKNSILTDPLQVPDDFANSILKFDNSKPSKNVYLLNMHSNVTGRKGTAVYLGDKTLAEAQAFKAKIESLFIEDHQGKQVMVWYNCPQLNRLFDGDRKPEPNENVSKSSVAINKVRK